MTLFIVLLVVLVVLQTGSAKAVSAKATVIAGLSISAGVLTAQMVNSAIVGRRAEEASLQNYFAEVGKLLIEQPLRQSSPGDNLSTVVRAQTLAALEGLGSDHTRMLLQFLYDSELIRTDKPVVSLLAANLRGANLSGINLSGANLSGTNLMEANLSEADLSNADLSGAKVTEAQLQAAGVLDGAIMPDGRTYEDWIKDKEGSGKDVENE